jgi:hypothetical protein
MFFSTTLREKNELTQQRSSAFECVSVLKILANYFANFDQLFLQLLIIFG